MGVFLVAGLLSGLHPWSVCGQDPPPGRATAEVDPQKARLPLAEIRGTPAPTSRPVRALREQPRVRGLYEEARQALEDGELQRALDVLEQAFDLAEGDYYELPYLMALTKYRLGDHGQARSFAELAASLRPGAADVRYLLGALYRGQDQFDRAIEEFRTATLATDQEPNNPRVTAAWFWLGESLAHEGYLAAANEAYARFDEALWETHPEHRTEDEVARVLIDRPHGLIEARLELLRRLGQSAEAAAAAQEALEREPNDPYLGRLYARALLDAGRAAEALTYCRERLAARPTTPADETPAATAAPSSGLVSVAVTAARAANALDEWVDGLAREVADGRQLELAAAVAGRLADAGEHAFAVRLWQALAGRRPDDTDAAWALATSLRAAGGAEAALTNLAEFVRQNPQKCEVPRARLEAWLKRVKAPEELLRLVARLGESRDRDFATSFVLGTAAVAAGQPELAEKLFRAAAEARPDFALAHVAWGWTLLAQYRWVEAKVQAQAALEQTPKLAVAQYVLATAHGGLDESDEAEKAYRAALKQCPSDAGYARALAQHYRRTARDTLPAQRYFQEAVAADPTNAEAIENLIDSYLAGGKLEIARAQLRQAEAHDLPEDALRRMRTTLRYARTPYQAEHLAELTRQFAEFPSDIETGLKLAAGRYVRNRPDEAFGVLERVLAQTPDDERATILLARVQTQRLERGPAIQILEELVRRYPNRPEHYGLLAENYLADFRLAEARRTLARLLEMRLGDVTRAGLRGRLLLSYVEFSEFDEAWPLLDAWIKEDPEGRTWAREKLRVLVLAGRQQEALDWAAERLRPIAAEFERLLDQFKRALERFQAAPDDSSLRAQAEQLRQDLERRRRELVERRRELVQVGLDARRFKLVEEQVRSWLSAESGDPDALEWLVQTLIADGRADEALEVLKGFRPSDPPTEVAARGWRALAQAAAGRVDQAVAEMESVLSDTAAEASALPPTSRAEVWQDFLGLLIKAGRHDEALKACDRWVAELGRGGEALRVTVLKLKSSILMQAGRMDEYSELAESLLEFAPDDTGLNNDLGYSWVDAGQNLERATRMIRKAVADEPLRAAYLDSLGWAYYKAGDFAGAQEQLRRATRLREGQDPVVYDHLADAEYRLGDAESARRHWQKTLELVEKEQTERDRTAQTAVPQRTKLVASVRAKLAALERSAPPEVAPTAAEQGER